MLRFTVDHPAPGVITDRFVALVIRLLPPGWSFSISPPPRVAQTQSSSDLFLARPLPSVLLPGFGQLRRTDPFGTMEAHADAWRRRFREALSGLAVSSRTSDFRLIADGDILEGSVFADSYVLGVIDVPDFERMPDFAAAGALVHALQESHPRETDPTLAGFHQRHQDAIAGLEAQVMGGTRLEDERLTRPRGIDPLHPPAGRAYEIWTPYRMPNGFIRAVVLEVREMTILRGRTAGFSTLEEFRRTVPR
ncbi:MAG TPA: hypothetical protein VFR81_29020 [Longimicrobium sp.]|nr:hypothetical protein [Longimicrobium sp.]